VPVQGDGAAARIADVLKHLSDRAKRQKIDMILLARGGGSLEDLWQFNEEVVARAIAASVIPIITGIGHEVDVSIADLVADHHAHTPTEAAQVAVARWRIVVELLDSSNLRIRRAMRAVVQHAAQRLLRIETHEMFRRPLDRINMLRQRLDDRQGALGIGLGHRVRREQMRLERITVRMLERHPRSAIELGRARLSAAENRLRSGIRDAQRRRLAQVDSLRAQLEALSPHRVLQRGYSMTVHKKRGRVVRSAAELREGDRLVTHFVDGSVESTVNDANQPSLFE
jgi:exodeoxyribonuclease VII large subunit